MALWVTQLPGHRAVSAWPWGPSSTTLSYDSPRQAARAQEGERPVGAEMDLQVIGCDRGQPREEAQETKRTHCVNTSPTRQLDSAGLTPLIQCPGSVRFASLVCFFASRPQKGIIAFQPQVLLFSFVPPQSGKKETVSRTRQQAARHTASRTAVGVCSR